MAEPTRDLEARIATLEEQVVHLRAVIGAAGVLMEAARRDDEDGQR
jgi:outer membrane murein-binding lipoprotein Lpp